MPHPLHVLVRAGDPITRAGLAAQLSGCPDIAIVDEPPDGPSMPTMLTMPAMAVATSPAPELATAGASTWAQGATARPAASHAPAPTTTRGPWRAERSGPAPRGMCGTGGTDGNGRGGADGGGGAGGAGSGRAVAVDVALVSAEDVGEDTLRTVRELTHTGIPVVLVVADIDSHDLTAAVDAGVVGLLRRAGAIPETVLAAVRGAASGEGYLPPDLLGPLLRQVRQVSTQVLAPRGLTFSGLSERELTVLRLVSEGLDTREIGRRLCYSERTVKNVLQDVTRRFGLRNRSHAVAYAFRHGLL